MGYKDYQQVLNLSSTPKAKKPLKKSAAVAAPAAPVKRRTKTGCFTCRRRKKKCDMEKTDGKCQACIRNFLECSWPDAPTHIHTPQQKPCVPATPEPVKISKGAEAYPSPVHSPSSEYHSEGEEIKSFSLPQSKSYKITKASKTCDKKSKEKTKFIITSFNVDNELCHVRA